MKWITADRQLINLSHIWKIIFVHCSRDAYYAICAWIGNEVYDLHTFYYEERNEINKYEAKEKCRAIFIEYQYLLNTDKIFINIETIEKENQSTGIIRANGASDE